MTGLESLFGDAPLGGPTGPLSRNTAGVAANPAEGPWAAAAAAAAAATAAGRTVLLPLGGRSST